MYKDILKLIFNRLPTRFVSVFLSIYRAMIVSRIYYGSQHFPVNYIKKLNLPIFGTSSKIGYFYRYYQEKRLHYEPLPENLFNFKYEIIYGEHRDTSKTIEASKTDVIVPVCLESEQSNLIVTNHNTNEKDRLKNLPEKRFHYFKINQGESYTFSSDSKNGFLIGKPLALKQKVQHSKKLVLCIFLDGLSDFSQIDSFTEETLMPNTVRFFSKGVSFKNHFSNAEWTLPSVPSFFSGGRQQLHGFFDPKANHIIGDDYKILSEIFHDNEYLTFQANGNWGVSPAYGYVKGFDRTIYKKEINIHEVIHSFFEHMRTFKDRDNFVWLTFMDVHHLINAISDISNQSVSSISAHCVTPWHDQDNQKKFYKEKSVSPSSDKNLTEIYANEIKRVDYYLKAIYDYIENNYKNEEFIVSLVSDHGRESADENPISISRTKVPWMIRGGNIPQYDSYELTENIDFFRSIIECSGLKMNHNVSESMRPSALGGKESRKFVISQSIYPGQTYKAIIRDKFFEYEFETTNLVSASGKIMGDVVFKKSAPLINIKIVEDFSKNIPKYQKIIESKISDWNIKQSS